MKRLVVKSQAGSLYYNDTQKGVKLEPHEITPHQRRLLLERLYTYEDTRLTPEQIRELKERDTAKEPEPAPMGMDGMVCPSCGKIQKTKYGNSEFGCILNYCSNCGQAIDENLEGME